MNVLTIFWLSVFLTRMWVLWGQESCLPCAHHGMPSPGPSLWNTATQWYAAIREMNPRTNVNFLPENLLGLPCQTWVHFHSSMGLSSACATTTLLGFSLLSLQFVWWSSLPCLSFHPILSSRLGASLLQEAFLGSQFSPSWNSSLALLFLFSTIPGFLWGLTSPLVKRQWPWRQALL